MEKVFWLMWLADIVGSIGIVAFICLIAAFILVIMSWMGEVTEKENLAITFKYMRWLAFPVILSVMLPSSKTIQVLAIASATDAAASTALGQKGLEALNAVLDGIINEKKPKK